RSSRRSAIGSMRKLRQLGYQEAGLAAAVATGYDPLCDDAPALALALGPSVQQRLAFGERTGQQVRRLGSGFGAEGEAPKPDLLCERAGLFLARQHPGPRPS